MSGRCLVECRLGVDDCVDPVDASCSKKKLGNAVAGTWLFGLDFGRRGTMAAPFLGMVSATSAWIAILMGLARMCETGDLPQSGRNPCQASSDIPTRDSCLFGDRPVMASTCLLEIAPEDHHQQQQQTQAQDETGRTLEIATDSLAPGPIYRGAYGDAPATVTIWEGSERRTVVERFCDICQSQQSNGNTQGLTRTCTDLYDFIIS